MRKIDYVPSSLFDTTALTPWDPSTQCKSVMGILGTVIGVVAAIAVPFIAPAIGAALGGGFFASVAGQALIGAGIGALGGGVGAALSGGSILQGALLGGAGGAIAGGIGAFASGAGFTTAAPDAAGTSFFYGSAGVPAAASVGEGTSALYGSTGTPLNAPTATGAIAAAPTSTPTTTGAVPAAIAPTTGGVTSGLSTAFKTAALQSLMAGGVQAMKALMPDQQAAMLDQMKQEMEVTKGQDAAAYAAQLKIFNDYYAFAKTISPEFFAQLERNNESQRMATTWADSERALRGSGYGSATIASERRRNEVQGVAGLDTASTNGYMHGLQAKDVAYQTASGLYPKSQPSHMYDMQTMYNIAGAKQADQDAGIAGIIQPWQVYAQHRLGVLDNSKPT
jgi:hypothetical protein